MKLTKAQRELLTQDSPVFLSRYTSEVFISDGQGFTMRVNKATFNALTLRGFLAKASSDGGIDRFERTHAGRLALKNQESDRG